MSRFVKLVAIGSMLLAFSNVPAGELTLEEAIDIAVSQSGRGGIIHGHLEVAEQQYFAEKIGFYLPELSINGRVPAYSVREDFDFAQGTDLKFLIRRADLDFDADITLQQNLITGGDLTLRANLVDNDWQYPLLRTIRDAEGNVLSYYLQTVEEDRRRGTFNFTFEQPLLKPSEPKFQLRNRRDELEIARMSRREEAAKLEKEVIGAYLGTLKSRLDVEKWAESMEKAELQAGIDSLKLRDGVVSEEQWLESVAARLDAELDLYEQERVAAETERELATLLDLPSIKDVELVVPENVADPDPVAQQQLLARWEDCVPLMKAKYHYDKEKRSADYVAGSHGLTGALRATYGLDRGQVADNREGSVSTQDLETDSWSVSLNFSYPIWDGGASGAVVKAARLSAEQARLEYQKTEKSVQAEIAALINQLNVSYRKLDVLKQKIAIEQTKLDIARSRLDDGQISELTYLDARVSFLEAKNKYLDELKTYYSTKVDLDSKYLD